MFALQEDSLFSPFGIQEICMCVCMDVYTHRHVFCFPEKGISSEIYMLFFLCSDVDVFQAAIWLFQGS